MNPVWLVARREIRERVKARSFRIATAITAGVVVAVIAIPAAQRGDKPEYDVAVVRAPTSTTVAAIQGLAERLGMRLKVRVEAERRGAEAGLRSGRYDIVVIGAEEILVKQVPDVGSGGRKGELVSAIGNTMRIQRALSIAGPNAAAALAALEKPIPITGVQPPVADARARITAFVGVMLLFVFLQQYGAWVLMGVIEEKSSRVVEVLLAAVRPRQLVAGKVLGIGAVALVQGIVVATAAIVTAQATGAEIFEGTSRYAVLWAFVWFLLGYGFYSWAYAAVGSLVSRQADAQNAAFPLSVPVIVGYITTTSLLSGADPSLFTRVLSYVPITSPMVMPMLIGLDHVSGWQIAIAMALSVAGIAVLVRLAGDVYSRAILHTGQRLHLRQVLRRDFSAA